ncbi:MAG TPA: DUF4926 domain-containing protein [Pirellulaceae bacterium]|jgi:hypothetical protein|nr:DUF4926 domain-containing protein [Pirellulaceae bacterium]
MSFELHNCVALNRDLPERGLKSGDLGAVVHVYDTEAFEVEFVTPSGETAALLTLHASDLRSVDDGDVLAVRRLDKSA